MFTAQAEAAVSAAQAEAARARAEAESVRKAAASDAERLDADRKKFLVEQAERDALRAAQDEARAKQLLDEVCGCMFDLQLVGECVCVFQAAAARLFAEAEAKRRLDAERAAEEFQKQATDAVRASVGTCVCLRPFTLSHPSTMPV